MENQPQILNSGLILKTSPMYLRRKQFTPMLIVAKCGNSGDKNSTRPLVITSEI